MKKFTKSTPPPVYSTCLGVFLMIVFSFSVSKAQNKLTSP
ncbi:MAG: hypothetical protein RL757_467, partial [Bacteroidota bacterium]